MQIAIISDIHSNAIALGAVINEIKNRGIKQIFCCGDIIGYASMPNECIRELIKNKVKCIYGSHEYALLHHETLSWFNYQAIKALLWHRENLKRFAWEWLKKLEEKMVVRLDGKKIMFVHGSPNNCFEYVWPETSNEIFSYWLNHYGVNALILGHTHLSFIKKLKNGLILNPGSVGQPRDFDARASFAIVNLKTMNAKIVRVNYDIDVIAEDIKAKGLPNIFADRLYIGK